jgi:hypothetical protein
MCLLGFLVDLVLGPAALLGFDMGKSEAYFRPKPMDLVPMQSLL